MRPNKTIAMAAILAAGTALLTISAVAEQDAPQDGGKIANTTNEAKLQPGYRGVSLPAPGHQLQFLNKGDRVDVLITFDVLMADSTKEKATATVLQNVRVLDVAKPAKLDDIGAVKLMLNPTEAQYAALGEYDGKLNITKRAAGDDESKSMEIASFRKLFR